MLHYEISKYYHVPTITDSLKLQLQLGKLTTDLLRRNYQPLVDTPVQFTQLTVVCRAASHKLEETRATFGLATT